MAGGGGVAIAYDQDVAPETYHLLLWRYNEVANTWVTTVGDYAGGDINEPDSVAGVYRADSDDYTVALLQVRDTGTVTGRAIKLLHATATAGGAAGTRTNRALTLPGYGA